MDKTLLFSLRSPLSWSHFSLIKKKIQAGGSQLHVVRVEREMSRWRGYLHLHSMVTPGTYEEQSLSHQPARPGHFWNPSEDILCANTASLRFHVWGTGLEVRMTLKVSPSRGKFTTVFFWGRCTDLLSLHFFIRWLWAGHWVPLTISQSICLWSICCQHFALSGIYYWWWLRYYPCPIPWLALYAVAPKGSMTCAFTNLKILLRLANI